MITVKDVAREPILVDKIGAAFVESGTVQRLVG